MQECTYGEACTDYRCRFQHPPGWWVCDYGPLCFVAGCQGVHPPHCKQTPCNNIRHCNFVHLTACVHGAGCSNPTCNDLHPPPCENPSCNGSNCSFMHPSNPKYAHITSLTFRTGGDGGGQFGGKRGRQLQTPSPGFVQAAPSSQGYANYGNQPTPTSSGPTDKSNIQCRFGANCTRRPNCPFRH